jgi:hypothetical protein
MESVEQRLRAERPVHRAPESITDAVMRNLSRENGPIPQRSVVWPRFAIGFAMIAAVALLSINLLHPPQDDPLQKVPAAPSESLSISIPEIPAAHFEQLTLHLDQPLEQELQKVISDTRVAIQFVAASFLPEK